MTTILKTSDVEKNKTSIENVLIDKKPLVGYRYILAVLGFFLYFSMFFQRNGFPVALVAMVNGTDSEEEVPGQTSDTCISGGYNVSSNENSREEYEWSNSQQGIILGAYFWGFVTTKLFASRVGEVVGQRVTISVGIGASGILVVLSPLAASIDPYVLAATRFLTGACYGPLSSTLHSLLSAWAPRNQLAFIVSIVYAGSSFGGMIGLVLSGWLQDSLGWRMTFWLGGLINCLFLPFWIVLVRNSPKEHPWLSPYERKLLEENSYVTTKKTVPWKKILTSPYLYICILANFARCYLDVILTTEGPSFLTHKMGLDLTTSSYVCGGHYFISLVFVMIFGRISDLIIKRKMVSVIMARKIFHLMGSGITAVLLLGVVLAKCNADAVITLWMFMGATAYGTACSFFLSPIDVAPNYTATFMGIMAIGNIGSAITPSVTSALLNLNHGWNKAFYLTAAINVISCVVYVVYMTAEPQPWNFDEEEEIKSSPTKK